jgi:DNA repair exonuclease SbcCD ATPase subunit
MRTTSLILVGYKRFSLSNIRQFTYTPEALEQVILGSNGAGKSSLLRAIMNLVPEGKHFAPGGSYDHTFDHENQIIRVFSLYKVKAGYHEFWLNGVNLNDGGTQATQRELVEKHVNLTQDIIDLVTGKLRFSRMSSALRREWLMRISGTDFTFATQLHERFRVKARDLQGTINYLLENTKKMAEEIESLEEDYKTKDDEVLQLKEIAAQVGGLLAGRIVEGHSEKTITRMLEAYKTIRQRSDTILAETIRRPEAMAGKSKVQLEADLVKLRDRMMLMRGECNEHEKALEGIQSLIRHVGRSALDDPSILTASIAEAEGEIAYLKTQGSDYDCRGENPEGLLAIAEGIQVSLSELCATIPVNSANTYTRGEYTANTERHKRLSQQLLEGQNLVSKLEGQLEHAGHTPETNCPKCSTAFKPGWDPDLLNRMQAKVTETRNLCAALTTQLDGLSVQIEDFTGYSFKLGELSRLRHASKALGAFWDKVSDDQLVRNSPATIATLLAETIRRLNNQVRMQRVGLHLADLQSRMDLIQNSGDPKFLLARSDLLESQIFSKSNLMRDMVGDCGAISEEIYHLEKLDKLVEEMQHALADFDMYKAIADRAMQEDGLETIRDNAMARLGVLHTQTQRYRDLTTRYENNREQIIECDEKHSAFKLIARALSPTEGIIAETVKNFIGHFQRMLNEHVGMVWSYSMEVDAVIEDGASLTCKFPIIMRDSDQSVEDFSDGSTGQVSMFDFAFKLVAMELLGLVDYPLLADEFGKDFDEEHRERLVSYIKSLMDQQRFSQLFMVSHYSAMYGSFNQAEFVVLDDRNITRPDGCNTQVIIE